MIFELLILLVFLASVWDYIGKRVQNFPPGPIGLPLLGHLPLLGRHPWKTLCQWKTTYGPVIGIWFGSYRAVSVAIEDDVLIKTLFLHVPISDPSHHGLYRKFAMMDAILTVVINDAKLIREAMNMSVTAGRPKLNIMDSMTEDGIPRGIASTNGSQWMEQRKFAMKNLRDFGIGTKTMEFKITDEITELLKTLRARDGESIQVKGLFNAPVLNALWSIMFGDRMMDKDPDSLKAFGGLTSVIDGSNFATLAFFIPWIVSIAPRLTGFEKMTEGFVSIQAFLRKQIANHNVDYVENQPRDFIDAYTDEVRKTTNTSSSLHAKNDFMIYTVSDLFMAGTETTSTTLSWLCAYMIHHTHVQKKFQEEIDDIIGKTRVPSLTDRPAMPYTEAVLNEVMRFSTIFPFVVFHNATEDFEFHGFFIPKDTMILPNMYSVHFDKTIWGDPDNFRPERFIDLNGKFKKNEYMFPFSTGKRICIGEGLGRDELFLFATNLFQTFSVSAAGQLPSLEPHLGMVLSPQPFEMVLKIRGE